MRFELGQILMTMDAEDNLPPENVREALDRHLVRVIESRLKTDTEKNDGLDRVRSFFKFGRGRSCRVVTDLELNATLVSLPNEIFRGERRELEAKLYEKMEDGENEYEAKTRTRNQAWENPGDDLGERTGERS